MTYSLMPTLHQEGRQTVAMRSSRAHITRALRNRKAPIGPSSYWLEALEGRALLTITVQFTTYNLGGSFESTTLASNGWVGVLITANSNANPIGGFDLDSGTRGIYATMAQVTTNNLGTPTSTPTGLVPASAAGSIVDLRDSFFSNFSNQNFSAVIGLAEDNNGTSHTTTTLQKISQDYSFDPLADTATIDYGIGTRLHGAGSFRSNQTTNIPLAFVIVPAGSTIHVNGQFADNATVSNGFLVDQSFIAPVAPNTIANRAVFYNNSAFDGNNAAANASDDNPVSTDKSPLLPSGTATFANYTSYSKGLNGVIVDMTALPGTINASDFTFKIGGAPPASNDPSTWAAAPAPLSVTVRPVAGFGSSTRVEIIWADNAIQNQWLQVNVKADTDTGLLASSAFYFGNAIGDTGNSPTDAKVTAVDEIGARANPADLTSLSTASAIANVYDFNRDKFVNSADEAIAGAHYTNFLNALSLFTAPATPAVIVDDAITNPPVEPQTVVVIPATTVTTTAGTDPAPITLAPPIAGAPVVSLPPSILAAATDLESPATITAEISQPVAAASITRTVSKSTPHIFWHVRSFKGLKKISLSIVRNL